MNTAGWKARSGESLPSLSNYPRMDNAWLARQWVVPPLDQGMGFMGEVSVVVDAVTQL